jgi:uncharacterized protein (TIGR02145 family)
MRKKLRILGIIISGLAAFSCEEKPNPPVVTISLTDVSRTYATAEVSVTSDGGADITAKGVCWNTTENPTTSDYKTSDGIGTEAFTSNLTQLTPNTKYYLKAYAINKVGTGYSKEVSFLSDPVSLAQLTTTDVTLITSISAVSGGNILTDGGAVITVRGVCWSKEPDPTTDDNKTTDGSGTGSFTSNLTGLITNTTYYLRAYAITSAGTSYGTLQAFTTDAFTTVGQITDIDNAVYTTIAIGNQTWMKENLKVTHYNNGDPIPDIIDDNEWWNLITGAYCDYDNNPINSTAYGRLYNWYAVTDSRNLCPSGWHVPSDTEWIELVNYLGGESVAGGKLKEQGTSHWISPNTDATNLSGFTALPAGIREKASLNSVDFSVYSFMGVYVDFWTTTESNFSFSNAWACGFMQGKVWHESNWKFESLSVRCIKD